MPTREELIRMGGKPVAAPSALASASATPTKKASYTREELLALGGRPTGEPNVPRETFDAAPTQETEEKPDSFIKSLIKAPIKSLIVKPAVRAAEALAGVGVFGKTVKRGAEMNAAKGTDVDLPLLGNIHVEPVKPGVSGLKQAAGEGLESASYLAGGGAGVAGGRIAATGTKVIPKVFGGAVRDAAKRGAIEGVKSGALAGAGSSLQQDADIGGVIQSTLGGAAIGGAVGGAASAAAAGLGKAARSISERRANKAEERALLEAGAPDARVATKMFEEPAVPKAPAAAQAPRAPKPARIVDDEVAKEVVRQGVPEADVALIKTSSADDRAKMAKMLDARELQSTNRRVTQRATDVVGDTFLEKVARPIETANRKAARQLDRVAKGLNGKRVDPSEAVATLADQLEASGVTVKKNGQLDFKGSDFEGIKGAQTAITNAWGRARTIARTGDAMQMHRAKRFIDEIVNYGKAVEGLSGRAQGILKSFRRALDQTLDANFSAYNRVNTVYAETIGELDKIADAMGSNFKLSDGFANAKVGVTLRRLFSNTQSRGNLLQILESAQAIAKKYGSDLDEDIIAQAAFADTLERIFGAEAGNSFQGGIERALQGAQQAGSVASDIALGGPKGIVSGAAKVGSFIMDAARSGNQKAKLQALRKLLKRGSGTVFTPR